MRFEFVGSRDLFSKRASAVAAVLSLVLLCGPQTALGAGAEERPRAGAGAGQRRGRASAPAMVVFRAVPVAVLRGVPLPRGVGVRRERVAALDVTALLNVFARIEETQYTFDQIRGGILIRLNFFEDRAVEVAVESVDDMDGGGKVWTTLTPDGAGVISVMVRGQELVPMIQYEDAVFVAGRIPDLPYYVVRELDPSVFESPADR